MSHMRWFLDELLYGLLLTPPLGVLFWWMERREFPPVAGVSVLVTWEIVVILIMRATGMGVFGKESDRGRT